jgi:transposase-like protein
MAYSDDFKKRALEYREEGHTIKETCEVFKIGTTTLKKWMRLFLAGETLKNKKRKRESKVYPAEKIRAYNEANPLATLSQIAKHFGGSVSGADSALKRLKITFKKRQHNI